VGERVTFEGCAPARCGPFTSCPPAAAGPALDRRQGHDAARKTAAATRAGLCCVVLRVTLIPPPPNHPPTNASTHTPTHPPFLGPRYTKEPEAQLNPKKKQFEKIAPDLRVDAGELLRCWRGHPALASACGARGARSCVSLSKGRVSAVSALKARCQRPPSPCAHRLQRRRHVRLPRCADDDLQGPRHCHHRERCAAATSQAIPRSRCLELQHMPLLVARVSLMLPVLQPPSAEPQQPARRRAAVCADSAEAKRHCLQPAA
jgi:hypothetical protein